MTAAEQLRPARPVEGFEARPLPRPDAALSRSMYDRVGGPWQWTDRLGWGIARWRAHLAQPSISTWLGYLEGEEVGYAELAREGGDVEIASFGLLPGFAGRGMGGALLAAVTEAAWDDGAERVWLHTCSLDSPAALPAYEARGFRRYDERTGR
jgi:GNAT superfamily N-acetyltransferase